MVETDRITSKITRAREQLLKAVEGMGEDQMAQEHGESWSIREILHHIGIAERANMTLVRSVLAGDPARLEDFDLDAFNVEHVSKHAHLPAATALETLQDFRQQTLNTLQNLTEEELATILDHPGWGEMTIAQLLRALGVHDTMHRRDIMKRIEGSYGSK